MSFLAPLFLLGALAIVGPVLFHLIRRTTRERRPFSTLMFLRTTPPQVQRRSQLEHLFLLLLRCTVLGLLATGFARPFLQQARPQRTGTRPGRQVAVLLDRSASMRRENLWPQAQAAGRKALEELGPEDQAALFGFDRRLQPLTTFAQWRNAPPENRAGHCEQVLRDLLPGWGAADLGNALLSAVEFLEESLPEDSTSAATARQIVVISDFAAGSRLTGLQGYEWREGIQVVLKPLRVSRPTNASLQPAPEGEDAVLTTAARGTRVRVGNAPESTRDWFRVGWEPPSQPGTIWDGIEVYVAPGTSQLVQVPEPTLTGPWQKLVLQGDDHDFDNAAYVIPVEPQPCRVLYVGREAENDPGQPFFYLRRAMQRTARHKIDVVLRHPDSQDSTNLLDQTALVIVADPLPEAWLRRLNHYVAEGRTALFLVKAPAVALALASWPGLGQITCEEGQVPGYALLGQVNFQHPLFLPFADARYSDFTKIHFWKYRHLPTQHLPAAQVLASFDNGAPALVELQVQRGTLLLLTSSWHPADSQLALSSKFVPFLYALLQQTAGLRVDPGLSVVDHPVSLPIPPGSGPALVRRPDGLELALTPSARFEATQLPGVYQASSSGWTQSFAVNLALEESKTSPLPLEQLEQLGVPLLRTQAKAHTNVRQASAARQRAELEQSQKLWRWLIVAALAVALAESWLAARLSRSPPQGAAPATIAAADTSP